MEAREQKSRLFNERYVSALLGVVIAAGLWQGYGAWLLGGHHGG
jgi:hypothetical protein